MDNLLFKSKNSEIKNTKIGDTNFKKHYPAINENVFWTEFKPYIRQSISTFIIPYIGQEFYDVLVATFNSDEESDLFKLKLLEKFQDSIAYFSIAQAVPFLNVTIGDMGVSQKQSENNTTSPVNQWRYKSIMNNSITNGYSFLDQALSLMEANIDNGYLATWLVSDEYIDIKTNWFKTTSELNKYLPIRKSRRNFSALVQYLRESEYYLQEILCETFYNEFYTKIKNGSQLNQKETKLSILCKTYLANMAMVKGIPNLSIQLSNNGFHVIHSTDSFDTKTPAETAQIDKLKQSSFQKASKFKDDIIKYLFNNIDDFETFKNSGPASFESEMVISSDDGVGGIMIV